MIRFAAALICLLALSGFVGCGERATGDADVAAAMRLYDRRKFAEAIPHFEDALKKSLEVSTRSEVLTAIGNCYNQLEQFETSLEYHDRAIKEDATNYKAYVNKGVVLRLQGDYDGAAKLYSQALEMAPNYAELHASIGALALFQDDYDKAVAHLERAVALDDSLAVGHANLSLAYATVGRFDEAEQQLKMAVVRGYHQADVIKARIEELRKIADNEE